MDPMTAIVPLNPGMTSMTALSSASTTAGAGALPFAKLFTDSVGQVNQLEAQAEKTVGQLISGTGVDVHTAAIAAQKANMAFEMMLAVRNKAVQAYQQVMNMQF